MKRTSVLVLILVLVLTFSVSASEEWRIQLSTDEMTGEEIWYAFSPRVSPTKPMAFPYSNVTGVIGIGNDGQQEWVYIMFTEAPNLINTSIRDGYALVTTRIKWDDEDPETVKFTQTWGSKAIHFQDDKKIIDKIIEKDTLLIELEWYGSGKVYFRFPLDGAEEAINKIRNRKN